MSEIFKSYSSASVYNSLVKWANQPNLRIECSSLGGNKVVLSQGEERFSFRRMLGKIFKSINPELSRYKGLKDALKNVITEYRPEQKKDLKAIFKKIRSEFLEVQKNHNNIVSTVQANDLLEAYNTVFSEPRLQDVVTPIKAADLVSSVNTVQATDKTGKKTLMEVAKISEKQVLLVEYRKIIDFVTEVKKIKDGGGFLTEEEIKALCDKQLLKVAEVPMGKMIELLYRHKFTSRYELEKVITKIASWQFASTFKVTSVYKTVKFFQNLRIDLWIDVGGRLYSFSELFGYDLREAKSYQESFTRPLTDRMKKRLLKPFMEKRNQVQETLGDKNAQVICSTAFAQITLLDCPKGSIDVPRTIRGKALSEEAEKPEEIGLEGKTSFTLHNLLGGYSLSDEKITTKEQAQGQLLGGMVSLINDHNVKAVVQRLATSDPHHFFATANATVLTRKECVEELQKQFENDPGLRGKIDGLVESFKDDQGSTINIAGSTLSSVSPIAVRKEPSILATNDRKIMMVRHEDGCIAVHAFIGATAVNNVDVTVLPGDIAVGADYGSMKYGSESKEDWITAKTGQKAQLSLKTLISWPRRMVISVLNFLRSAKEKASRGIHIEKGSSSGGFPAGGSTVVSIYFARDYLPTPEVSAFAKVAVRDVSSGSPESIEMQCQLGDTLATPVAYQTIELMRSYKIPLPTNDPLETLRLFHAKLCSLENTSSFEQTWKDILDSALQEPNFEKMSGDDRYMLDKLIKAITAPIIS